MVSKYARKNIIKKSNKFKKKESMKLPSKLIAYRITTGQLRTIKVKNKIIKITKSKLGSKIFKKKEDAIKLIKSFKESNPFKYLILKPRVSKTIIRNPILIKRLKKAKIGIIV